jgi:hypothetical protein
MNFPADLPRRPRMDNILRIAVAPDDKARLFELAAQRRVTVSELVRTAVARVVSDNMAEAS